MSGGPQRELHVRRFDPPELMHLARLCVHHYQHNRDVRGDLDRAEDYRALGAQLLDLAERGGGEVVLHWTPPRGPLDPREGEWDIYGVRQVGAAGAGLGDGIPFRCKDDCRCASMPIRPHQMVVPAGVGIGPYPTP